MPWVFHAFEQPGKRPMGGLGLGLTIAKTLVDYHGGTIAASSAGPGLGSTFTVTVDTIAPPAARPGQVAAPGGRPSPKILFVEDNPDLSHTARTLIEDAGNER